MPFKSSPHSLVSCVTMAVLSISAVSDAAPLTIPLWPAIPPHAPRQLDPKDQEVVVERGDGKQIVDRSIHNVHRPTLTVHVGAKRQGPPRAAVIICPGGGLTRIVIDKEGNDLARFLAPHGVIGVVLKFRTARSATHFYGIRAMEADTQQAIRMVRERAAEWNIDPNRVGVFGFSAGGILAGAAATRYVLPDKPPGAVSRKPNGIPSTKPDFLAAAYPLLTMKTEVAGKKYQQLLFGPNPTPHHIKDFSCDLKVTRDTPPTFLAHARDDRGVLVENTLLFAAACRRNGVPVTTFIRDKGGHGYGVRDLGTPINRWRFAFRDWLKSRKLTGPPVR